MKTLEKIVYMTEKGQITLPVVWRRMVGTNAVRISSGRGDTIEIAPVGHTEDKDTGWVSVFNARRDNQGKGLTPSQFLRTIGRSKNVLKK